MTRAPEKHSTVFGGPVTVDPFEQPSPPFALFRGILYVRRCPITNSQTSRKPESILGEALPLWLLDLYNLADVPTLLISQLAERVPSSGRVLQERPGLCRRQSRSRYGHRDQCRCNEPDQFD